MSARLVWLHGVKGPPRRRGWLDVLNRSMPAGQPDLKYSDVRVVDYQRALRDRSGGRAPLPAPTEVGSDHAEARRRYRERVETIRSETRSPRQGRLLPGPGDLHPWVRRPLAWNVRKMARFDEAEAYRRHRDARSRGLSTVLDQLPEGDYELVAHSLGLVVAADLLAYLPSPAACSCW